jgi:hypothetical protein
MNRDGLAFDEIYRRNEEAVEGSVINAVMSGDALATSVT